MSPKPKEPVLTKFQAMQAKLLIGRTIRDVQFSGHYDDDPREMYPVLVLDNSTCVVIQQDDEGNGPGSMMFQHVDGRPVDMRTGEVVPKRKKEFPNE